MFHFVAKSLSFVVVSALMIPAFSDQAPISRLHPPTLQASTSSMTMLRKAEVFLPAGKRTALSATSNLLNDEISVNASENLYIAQFDGSVKLSKVVKAMQSLGINVDQYLQEGAFLIRADGEELQQIAKKKNLIWLGNYTADMKLAPELTAKLNAAQSVDLEVAYVSGSKTLRSQSSSDVLTLAQSSAVKRIGLAYEAKLMNDKSVGITNIDQVWASGSLTGEGQIVGHADSGLDVGVNDATLHPDIQGRLVGAESLGRTDNWSDDIGHGTHTALTIAGNGAASAGLYKGAAPQAKLYHQSLTDPTGGLGGIPDDLADLFEPTYLQGARIHSDSWGKDNSGEYNTNCSRLDHYVFNDGDPKNMLICFSAGNQGPYENSIGAPGSAKNCIAVGNSENYRPEFALTDCDNIDEIASSSSRGPTDDGRIKPDIAAPGTWIASGKTRGEVVVLNAGFENDSWNQWARGSAFGPTTSVANSGSWSMVYSRGKAEQVDDDYLDSPVFSIPHYCPYPLRFSILGHIPGNLYAKMDIFIRTVDLDNPDNIGSWIELGSVSNITTTSWINVVLNDTISNKFSGEGNVQLRFNPRIGYNQDYSPAENDMIFYLDDIQIRSASSWDSMANRGLASEGDAIDQNYTLNGGTSMSCPLVAGAAALVREHFVKNLNHDPSAALVKALLINGATDLGPEGPDNDWGWGRMDLKNSLFPDAPRKIVYEDGLSVADGETQVYNVSVTDSTQPLRINTVWMDKEGSSLQNNVDFWLVSPDSQPYYPYNGQLKTSKTILASSKRVVSDAYSCDLDGDGDKDLVFNSKFNNEILWLENIGSGYTEHSAGDGMTTVTAFYPADMDGDGDIDIMSLALGEYSNNTIQSHGIYCLVNDGSQNFTKQLISTDVQLGVSMAVGDFDGDTDLDFVTLSHSVYNNDTGALVTASCAYLFRNNGGLSFTPVYLGTTNAPYADFDDVYAADMDGNGSLDLVTCSDNSAGLEVWLNNGLGAFGRTLLDLYYFAQHVKACDMDLDGDMDILLSGDYTLDPVSGEIAINPQFAWMERTAVGYVRHIIEVFPNPTSNEGMDLGDIDQDGDMDVIACVGSQIKLYENDGSMNFTIKTFDGSVSSPYQVLIDDMNGSGSSDIIITTDSFSSAQVLLFANDDMQPDSKNNVEGIDIAAPAVGEWKLHIRGTEIPFGPQPVSVVISGAVTPKAETGVFGGWTMYQ